MSINQLIGKRFIELAEQGERVPIEASPEGPHSDSVDTEAFQMWASSAMQLVANVFGKKSPHYQNLSRAYRSFHGWAHELAPVRGVFSAAKSDFEGGYLFSLEKVLAGEVFGDFVVLAKLALNEGKKDVAGVLASAALEDALKRYAQSNGLEVDGKEMTSVISALKSKGLLSGPQKTLVDTMPKIRNAALHADWTNLTSQDVGSVIGYVEQFLLTNFS